MGLIVFLIHAPSLTGEFIWDDVYLAHDSLFIKSPLLILETFRHHLFLDSYSAHYRPVQNLSFIFDYFLWNDNSYGFHLTSVMLHALSGVLLYFLLRRILLPLLSEKLSRSGVSLLAFLVALIWAVHPIHSAAVDYISGRADSLAFLFASAAWLLFMRAQENERKSFRTALFFLAAAAALLALCSRETACLWLIIFAGYSMIMDRRLQRHGKILTLTACVVLMTVYAGLRHLPEQRPGPGPTPGWSAPVKAILMTRSLGDYGGLLLFPTNLHMERTVLDPGIYLSAANWEKSIGTEYLSILGLITASALAIGCFGTGAGSTVRRLGAAWFFIGFLPVSNLFDLNATVAEHWLYLPSVGALLFLAGVALEVPRSGRRLVVGATAVAVIALSLRAFERSGDWTTAEHFYERTIAAGGTSVRVSVNLGQIYATRGEYGRAEKIFRKILVAVPDYPIAQSNLANALYQQGKKKEAEALFATALAAAPSERKDYPRTWIAALNLAGIRQQQNDYTGSLKILNQARADYPNTWELVSLEAEIYRSTKKPAEAQKLVADFAQDHWWHYGASLALGRLYAESGDVEAAVRALRHASRLDIHEVDALNLIAAMRVRQNRLSDAIRAQKLAVSRQPDAPRQYMLLSDILERMGQTAEARDAIAQVTRLETIGRGAHTLAN